MRKPRPTLDEPCQDRLGEKLRDMYDGLPREPVPERLQSLVDLLQGLGLEVRPAIEPISLADRRRAALERAEARRPVRSIAPSDRRGMAVLH